ncbi:unnamed protein product [Enterobius vermicularis]|uniref:BRCA1-associated protein n=1 Tax=Enterobius vermicularis TaxID=51028 RepID=A0A0N4VJY9_ENTVE|nr:unnamed protein product [Enterobius vermicularis]
MPVGNRSKKAIARAAAAKTALPPVADNATPDKEKSNPSEVECLGRRKYADVVVQTFTGDQLASVSQENVLTIEQPQGCSMQPTTSGSSLSSKASTELSETQKIPFFSGNPDVEKTTGLLHLYKKRDFKPLGFCSFQYYNGSLFSDNPQTMECSMLCMIGVPSLVTLQELIKFVSPHSSTIDWMKIVRDQMPNQYMVIIGFKSHEIAVQFFKDYNGAPFSAIEPDKCSLVFVERIEMVKEGDGGSLPMESVTELPTCAVCLERMDDDVLTILCNHTFHAQCLEQWTDTTCPVCRYHQTPELQSDQKCFDCGKTTDLWICLICGNIGCGRYADAHAYRHFEITSHTFTMQIGGGRVWDYAGDNYVHRLIQNSTDGKMVEFQNGATNNAEVPSEEKTEAIQLEYTCLLTSQLENQRKFFENKLKEAEQRAEKFEVFANAQIESLNDQISLLHKENDKMKRELTESLQAKQAVEKKLQNLTTKHNKILSELSEERTMNSLLRADHEKWTSKVAELNEENRTQQSRYNAEITDLKEQVRDLMMHFEAQNKFQETVKAEQVSEKELREGVLTVESSPSKTKRRSKKS